MRKLVVGWLGALLFSACALNPPASSIAFITSTNPPSVASPIPTETPLVGTTHTPTATQLSPTPSPVLQPSSTPVLTPTSDIFAICSPLQGYSFDELRGIESQPFIRPRAGKDDGHHGVDFAHWQYKDRVSLEGVEVQSVLAGVVATAVMDKYPYGNMVIIETPFDQLNELLVAYYQVQPDQSLYLLYAHLKEPPVYQINDPIECGEVIGIVGNTGASGNPHLHFEVRKGPAGVRFVSMEYYKTTSSDEERANYERWRFLGEFILFDPWGLLEMGE